MNVLNYLMYDQLTMDFAVHSILCQCHCNCKILKIPILNFDIVAFLFCSKNAQEYNVGQENLYKDPCDELLDLINMKLTSPNYPEFYDPLTDCKWTLIANQGKYITLDFERIQVSKKGLCRDSLTRANHSGCERT